LKKDNEYDRIIAKPYVTEKTFNMIERENKLSFVVSEKATKPDIIKAMKELYESETSNVNTLRTIHGKKAIIKFSKNEGARELATKLGIV
jgi:large subunit ribosomal protein L23